MPKLIKIWLCCSCGEPGYASENTSPKNWRRPRKCPNCNSTNIWRKEREEQKCL